MRQAVGSRTTHGSGLRTEATRPIIGYGFEELGLHRISLDGYAFHPRARRAYEKGVLRDSLFREGERVGSPVMSILAPEWFRDGGRPETAGQSPA